MPAAAAPTEGGGNQSEVPMSSASTIASIVVALTAIVVVIRWPRPRADRRVLERRAQSLEALGLVVTRSAVTRPDEVARHERRHLDASADPASCRHVAITVLGSADVECRRAHEAGTGAPRPSSAVHRPPRRQPRPPTRVVQLDAHDLPPDEDLTQTVDGLVPSGVDPDDVPRGASLPEPTAAVTSPRAQRHSHHSGHSGTAAEARPRPASMAPPLPDNRPTPQRRHDPRRWAAVAVALLVILGGFTVSLIRPDPSPSAPARDEAGGATSTTSPPTTSPPPPLTPTGSLGESVAFALPPPFTLDLAAGDTTWVRVQATGGEVLFEGTLAPDDTASVTTDGPVELRVGNPAGLLAAAGGRLLDHPRPSGQPVTLAIG